MEAWSRNCFSSIRVLLLVALSVRLVLALGLQIYLDQTPDRSFLIAGDAAGYWELASNIAAGEPYEIYDPPRQILRMPGFPVVLTIPIKLFEGSFLAARIWLALFGVLAVYLCYRLALELADGKTAILAAWLVALHPVMAGFSVVILSETCFAASLLASLWSLQRIQAHPDSSLFPVMAGVLAAVATYMRPVWILFPLIWAVYQLFVQQRKTIVGRNLLLILIGMALTLSPWVYRNYQVSGQFVVTSLWSGPSLYDGFNPNATGASDMTFFETDNLPATMSEYEVDQEYRQRAWQFARKNPWRSFELAGLKAVRFWRPWPVAEEVSSPLIAWGIGGLNTILYLVVLLAIWRFRNRSDLLFYTLTPLIYFAVIHMLFVGSLRYRLPAEYPLLILAALFLSKSRNNREIDEQGAVRMNAK
ncbi:hypothetical protein Pla110_26490 [Polystyrenella longa]|uniref:Glycosyltransferase RgtA/B/C/D-like domain-containing protein n=1 Tax=Polystyrenella longa TaxID=2528007 RepID=A0A518CNX0_9PLAN|nr:glycosyltransferase family 39 protein [Polystyrenella longa]QDU80913.1 hypothetical protein Pla110_26490 [Polystyrenella longa]